MILSIFNETTEALNIIAHANAIQGLSGESQAGAFEKLIQLDATEVPTAMKLELRTLHDKAQAAAARLKKRKCAPL